MQTLIVTSKILLSLYEDVLLILATNRQPLICRREGERGNTHIDHCGSEASSAQDKVRHVCGAAWNPEGHVSYRRSCRTGEGKSHRLQWEPSIPEMFAVCFMNFSELRHRGGMTLQRDCCILIASTCLHPLIRLHNPALVTRRQQSGWKDLAAAKLNSKLSPNYERTQTLKHFLLEHPPSTAISGVGTGEQDPRAVSSCEDQSGARPRAAAARSQRVAAARGERSTGV